MTDKISCSVVVIIKSCSGAIVSLLIWFGTIETSSCSWHGCPAEGQNVLYLPQSYIAKCDIE